jgi:hypothetical protein
VIVCQRLSENFDKLKALEDEKDIPLGDIPIEHQEDMARLNDPQLKIAYKIGCTFNIG